ncbi:nucleotidyltransferase family protein [Thiomicrorhabdus sp. Milos-T2]|uniref:nucleotidyltransferase family protein n=1 Tax=Thiomicrorhabdus sp. Milos-T2 TaxID=90814 RepID=UPI000493F722|nr:nucleotidyltransferase domain-containing protein [Thiomicrorhabdus sp. Milos-T2]
MKPSEFLADKVNLEKIKSIILKYSVSNPVIFGSVARGDDREDSDIDILVEDSNETDYLELADMIAELEAFSSFNIDLSTTYPISERTLKRIMKEAIIL